MTTKQTEYDRLTARKWTFRIVVWQLVATAGIAALFLLFGGLRAGYSALVGAIICVIPSFYLAVRMFRVDASASAERVLRSIYLGEAIKVLLTVALFVIAFMVLDVDLLIVGAAFMAGVLVYWLALLFPEKGIKELGVRQADVSK